MKFLRKFISPKALLVLAIALVLGQCIDPSMAFAGTTTSGDNETLKAFATLFSVFVNIFTFLSLVFLNYGGDLVGTEFLTTADPMGTIRPMWVIIRNITNVMFVLMLLFLAFANLFSSFAGDGGNWTIKEKLPKIILALIAINFSLLGFKVIIDAVHVGTITIFAIPDSTLQAKGKNQLQDMLLSEVSTPTDGGGEKMESFYVVMNELMCGENWNSDNRQSTPVSPSTDTYTIPNDPLPDDCLFAIDPSDTRVGSAKSKAAHNLFLAFGIQFQKLQELPALASKMNDWSDVFTSVLFVSILSLAQVVALAAVFIVLLIRVIVLWIAMVFSPALIAAAIMGFGGGGSSKLGEQVITNLIMPLKIAAAFAVSFLMMDTMMSVGGPSGDFIKTGLSVSTFGATGYGLLWSIATIVVFWKAAFWAMEGSAGEEIANKIKGGAESAGAFMARAGTIDREFFPMPGMDGANKVALSSIWKATTTGVKTFHDKQMQKDARSLTDSMGLTNKEKTGNMEKVDNAIDSQGTTKMNNDALLNFLKKYGMEAFRENSALGKKLYAKLETDITDKISEDDFVAAMNKSNISGQKEALVAKLGGLAGWSDLAALDDKGTEGASKSEVAGQNTFETVKGNDGIENKQVRYSIKILQANPNPSQGSLLAITKAAGIGKVELKDVSDEGLLKLAEKMIKNGEWTGITATSFAADLKKIREEKDETPPANTKEPKKDDKK